MRKSLIKHQHSRKTQNKQICLNKFMSLNQNNNVDEQISKQSSLFRYQSMQEISHVEQSQQIVKIQQFVQEITLNPKALYSLFNFQQLVSTIMAQNTETKHRIQSAKAIRKELSEKNIQQQRLQILYQISKIRQDQIQTENSTKFYRQLIEKQQQEIKAKKQQKKIKMFNIEKQIFKCRQINSQVSLNHSKTVKQIKLNKKQISQNIKKMEQKIQALHTKFETNTKKQKVINELASQVKKAVLITQELKKNEIQQIQAHKSRVNNKKSTQNQSRKISQKKLSKFIQQLNKIIQKSDKASLANLIANYQFKPDIRNKNESSETKPDENQQSSSQNHGDFTELQKIQLQNPSLKTLRPSSVKPLQISKFVSQNLYLVESKENQTHKIQQQRKIKQKQAKLHNQQTQVQQFLTALKDKISKINSQLTSSAKKNL